MKENYIYLELDSLKTSFYYANRFNHMVQNVQSHFLITIA